ncbi:hypothetical protein L798_06049 [Zootermopsis nevadensis]|uniref:Uncharacterized protein n=1 Tax=Zootermopsis nevadensis TaxID=136037 RepID=A0A067RIY3_ZOONE|nr:hypothetical protein L798_06049 [Zootermopsis nevadensis]
MFQSTYVPGCCTKSRQLLYSNFVRNGQTHSRFCDSVTEAQGITIAVRVVVAGGTQQEPGKEKKEKEKIRMETALPTLTFVANCTQGQAVSNILLLCPRRWSERKLYITTKVTER